MELVQDWIKALRSGKYKQGKGFLEKDGKYCCLGVLCEITDCMPERHRETSTLPGELMDRLPEGFEEGCAIQLAQYNDEGQSFDAIADKLEVADWDALNYYFGDEEDES